MDTRKRNISLESILVMFLLLIFAVSSSVIIVQGSQSYEGIINDKEHAEHARIALSYLDMRIKQNDSIGQISFETQRVEGQDALVIKHSGEEAGYLTYIYWMNGYLWECYTDALTEPSQELSSEIVPVDALGFQYEAEENAFNITIQYQYGHEVLVLERWIAMKTKS